MPTPQPISQPTTAVLVLYSFRRCPYAIRARLALAAAGLRPGVDLELREVHLAAKPPELLEVFPRGTVPVLLLADPPDGQLSREQALREKLSGEPLFSEQSLSEQPLSEQPLSEQQPSEPPLGDQPQNSRAPGAPECLIPATGPVNKNATGSSNKAVIQSGVNTGIKTVAASIGVSAQGQAPARSLSATQVPQDAGAGAVLGESLAIMQWALNHSDPEGWLQGRNSAEIRAIEALIAQNDGPFKHHLDRWRYPDRYPDADPGAHHQAALAILRQWNQRLAPGGWLLGERPSLADMALLPFVRQFRHTDAAAFDQEPDLVPLQSWLQRFLEGAPLAAVMQEPWASRRPWRSHRWLYHLAMAPEWRQARTDGEYRRSSRGLALEEVGFIHAYAAHQIAATAERFFADAGEVVLLCIDPVRLQQAGVEVRWEMAPSSGGSEPGECFPHLYGPLPLAAVLHSEPWTRPKRSCNIPQVGAIHQAMPAS